MGSKPNPFFKARREACAIGLVGADIRRALADRRDLDFALIPAETMNDNRIFLDDDTFEAVAASLPIPVHPSYDFIDVLAHGGDAAREAA